jgi:sensor histidine kinase YesM
MRAIRLAGVNLPVFGAVVLAWYAATYYGELRDRHLKAAELESLLQQTQLQALRSQLNPHFLFNTLHSIAELIHENPKLAEDLILRLGSLLRQALAAPAQHEVPLAEEIAFVRSYVEIEQMRLSHRLQVTWDLSPDALNAKVPAMILQPLIENAIQHGIIPSERPGQLAISARRENGFLHLQVRDNGPGLPAGTDASKTGIGLTNTEARLRQMYGDQHHFEMRNDDGLAVTLKLPFSAAVLPVGLPKDP